ncbi:IS66 family insertion sequence element accessory protein TnpB [Sorangium sp. So ce260]|uniref:IS66 family insertion sequence element accessory protein TnpB n=1 Tax=Sorangium sp. So ce260 TaxID=3133291 RepID=UPI003F604649
MIPGRVSIYVATEPLDLRRSFDGLAAIVREVLRQDPLSGGRSSDDGHHEAASGARLRDGHHPP